MLRRVRTGEAGFSMAIVMIVMLVVSGIGAVSFAATQGDMGLNLRSTDSKKAYAAAEAAVAYYLSKLAADHDYWSHCTTGLEADLEGPPPVFQLGAAAAAAPGDWRSLAGDPSTRFAVELVPAAGKAACVAGDQTSMVDAVAGTFQIRGIGRSGSATRAVLATFRRKSFLDYVYSNDFETMDPLLVAGEAMWPPPPVTTPPTPTLQEWAASPAGCASYRRNGRDSHTYSYAGSPSFRCSTINYARTDELNGPFHSNDGVRIEVCGQTRFGRSGRADAVEFWDSNAGGGACLGEVGNSRLLQGSSYEQLPLPDNNNELRNTALPGYTFAGETEFTLTGSPTTMTVKRASGATQTLPLPPNGVISVIDAGGACAGYDPQTPNPAVRPLACGNARIQGSFAKDLTITTQRDIIVTGNVTAAPGSNALLGLVATDFVRIERKMAAYNPCNANTADLTPAPTERVVEAAILSLKHVLTVDSYWCGDDNGYLRIRGSIAQKFRGRTASSDPGLPDRTGYSKDYSYDERLRYRSPPFFLTPAQASWRVIRTTEQSGAA